MSNRLIHQTSPYLLQHAHNPVDWFPWGAEALLKAKAENKVILVSIGYSACHWCHVMERESFENEETAALMNECFINIKIDREERPDLDQVYMDAVQLVSGSGGWPLNVFLTPEAKPFYGGTYFPPVPAFNRSSWRDVLTAINKAWQEKPGELIAQAENLTDHLRKAGLFDQLTQPESAISETSLEIITNNLLKNADTGWGGFGNAPKFPQTFSIQYLLRQHYFNSLKRRQNGDLTGSADNRNNSSPLLSHALHSLDKMIMGGIYDQLAGGFARYSTDAKWLAPHFEKMLYDNALLITVISEAYQLTRQPMYLETIEQTMQFIAAEWQDVDGGFFSAYDADSEGEEGKFYTWHKSEIECIITDPEALLVFTAYYGVEDEGNWEHTNILWVQQPLAIFCAARGLEEMATRDLLGQCRKQLLQARNARVKPLLDDKKLMSWNALMITAACKAFGATGQIYYLQMAEKAAVFIEEKMKTGGIYHHNYKNGLAANPAFLDDLAFYIQALCHLQECTGKTQYIETARRLTQEVLANFQDQDTGIFFYTPNFQSDIIVRKKDLYDGATPSGNSIMVQNLQYLGIMLDNPAWKGLAEKAITQIIHLAGSYPGSFAVWAQLLQAQVYGVKEIVVVGENNKVVTGEVLKYFIPFKVLQQTSKSIPEYPLLKEKVVKSGETLIFLCFDYSCRQPVETTEDLFKLVNILN